MKVAEEDEIVKNVFIKVTEFDRNIMSDRLTIISRSGRVFEIVNYSQVLLAHGPLKIAVARPDMIKLGESLQSL
jgi:hypothetical protein